MEVFGVLLTWLVQILSSYKITKLFLAARHKVENNEKLDGLIKINIFH